MFEINKILSPQTVILKSIYVKQPSRPQQCWIKANECAISAGLDSKNKSYLEPNQANNNNDLVLFNTLGIDVPRFYVCTMFVVIH